MNRDHERETMTNEQKNERADHCQEAADVTINFDGYAEADAESDRRAEVRDQLAAKLVVVCDRFAEAERAVRVPA